MVDLQSRHAPTICFFFSLYQMLPIIASFPGFSHKQRFIGPANKNIFEMVLFHDQLRTLTSGLLLCCLISCAYIFSWANSPLLNLSLNQTLWCLQDLKFMLQFYKLYLNGLSKHLSIQRRSLIWICVRHHVSGKDLIWNHCKGRGWCNTYMCMCKVYVCLAIMIQAK